MNWFAALFKRKEPGTVNDRYAMKLSVCHETYTVEEFDLQFKRNTDRDGLPEGEAYGGFVTCTLAGMPGDGLLQWGAYSQPCEDGDLPGLPERQTGPGSRIRPAFRGRELHPFAA